MCKNVLLIIGGSIAVAGFCTTFFLVLILTDGYYY
jgi:hypothetical protein